MAQDKLLDVEIVTPQKVVYSGKAVSVSVPGSLSAFQILYNHAPIVSSLDMGIIKIVDDKDSNIIYATGSGFTEVSKNKISILVESAFDAKELDASAINESIKKAKENLMVHQDKLDIAEAQNLIKQQENKLKAIDKLKK
jgi:F-type H+-transporting ATPase subunit epsilon